MIRFCGSLKEQTVIMLTTQKAINCQVSPMFSTLNAANAYWHRAQYPDIANLNNFITPQDRYAFSPSPIWNKKFL